MAASWPGTKKASGRENYPMLLTPVGPLHFGMAHPCVPFIWSLAPDVLSPRLLDLAAIDMKLVVVNWNPRFSHSNWAQRSWQEMKQTTWFGLATSLSCCLGLSLYVTNGAPSQTWGCLLPGRKVVIYLQEPPSLGNLRDCHDPLQLPLPNQIFGIVVLCVKPIQGCQKWDRVSCSGTLGELVGSHTKVVIHLTYAICCERLWSVPCLIPGSRGYR